MSRLNKASLTQSTKNFGEPHGSHNAITYSSVNQRHHRFLNFRRVLSAGDAFFSSLVAVPHRAAAGLIKDIVKEVKERKPPWVQIDGLVGKRTNSKTPKGTPTLNTQGQPEEWKLLVCCAKYVAICLDQVYLTYVFEPSGHYHVCAVKLHLTSLPFMCSIDYGRYQHTVTSCTESCLCDKMKTWTLPCSNSIARDQNRLPFWSTPSGISAPAVTPLSISVSAMLAVLQIMHHLS